MFQWVRKARCCNAKRDFSPRMFPSGMTKLDDASKGPSERKKWRLLMDGVCWAKNIYLTRIIALSDSSKTVIEMDGGKIKRAPIDGKSGKMKKENVCKRNRKIDSSPGANLSSFASKIHPSLSVTEIPFTFFVPFRSDWKVNFLEFTSSSFYFIFRLCKTSPYLKAFSINEIKGLQMPLMTSPRKWKSFDRLLPL